ncbi:amidohydrolase family protein [Histidinibacterium aquaticum]|uniref:Alkylphosphonate utilization protein n=1 Tax=Histidinibacterium aquaticum TaxID=2613962 RepID=A0A5J5GK84_9RHOB|nr:alkylphosphonate utilization protein [Histidinibacterium aquaticum]KAA9007964.1 alkylphosphonate utilization protein [Histidinibacterium aquaticum]
MPAPPPPMRLVGATVLRDGGLRQRTVAIEGGRISGGPFPAVDLSGFLVLPGLVDLDTARLDCSPGEEASALSNAEDTASANGVTTGWVMVPWGGDPGDPARAEAALRALEAGRARRRIDLRTGLRFDVSAVATAERLVGMVRRFGIGRVVFEGWSDCPPSLASEVPRVLCRMAEALDVLGCTYGSAGDRDGETREFHAMLGARLCERPVSARAAAIARAVGDPVVAPAPALEGGTVEDGAVSAAQLIRLGCCDALSSSGDPARLAPAALALAEQGLGLPAAWRLVSETPAELLRLPGRGRIVCGQRADLCVLSRRTGRIEATLFAGRLIFATGEAACRFSAAATTPALAAE